MANNTAKNILPSPLKKVGKLAVRAARAAFRAATTGALVLARSVKKTIYGTTGMGSQDRVRKQQYINVRDIKDHIYGLVGHLKIKYFAGRIDGNKPENKKGKKREVAIREPLEVSEDEVIDLLDDAFAPSFVRRGEHTTVDRKETWPVAQDLLVDVGSGRVGAPR